MNFTDASRNRFVPELEALRGMAALIVALHHSLPISATTPALEKGIINLLSAGQSSVTMFFVLSGFVLGESLRRQSSTSGKVFLSFVLRRLFRIYPAFLISTLFIFPLFFGTTTRGWFGFSFPDPHPFITLVWNLLFLEATINMVTWTLKVEFIASMLLPFLHGATMRFKAQGLVLILICLLFLSVFPLGLGRWPCFLLMFYTGYLLPLGRRWMCQFWSSGNSGRSALITLAIIILFGVHVMAEATTPAERRSLPNRLVHLAETGCSVVVISSLAYGTRTRLHAFLQQPLIRFFGMISFSFYLIHHPVLLVLENLLIIPVMGRSVAGSALARGLVTWGLSSALAAILAWLLFKYVEKTGVALGRSLTNSRDKLILQQAEAKPER